MDNQIKKGRYLTDMDFKRRDMRNWDPKKYSEEVGKIDWAPLLAETNIDLINSIFEEKLLEVMDKMAPEKCFQRRKNCNSWMTDELKMKNV